MNIFTVCTVIAVYILRSVYLAYYDCTLFVDFFRSYDSSSDQSSKQSNLISMSQANWRRHNCFDLAFSIMGGASGVAGGAAAPLCPMPCPPGLPPNRRDKKLYVPSSSFPSIVAA